MTTQATHTSGPWAALMQNPPTVSDRRGCRIATACQLPGDSMEEQQANARLIAAAPELLRALKNAREWLEELSFLVRSGDFQAAEDWAISNDKFLDSALLEFIEAAEGRAAQ